MLSSAGNQAIELSGQNSYKYAKMDNYDDDEVAFCHLNSDNYRESNRASNRTKRINVKKILIVLLSIISLAFILIATIGAFLLHESPVNYRGHKVYKLMPASVDDLKTIIRLEKEFQVSFWNEPHFKDPTEPILIQIDSGHDQTYIIEEFIKFKLNFTVVIEDLHEAIEEERAAHQKLHNETQFNFNRYHTFEEIMEYLETEVAKSNLAKISFIGKSFEGRKIPVIRITSDSNDSKPIILIDSLIHAKEWVTGATNLLIVNELISKKLMQTYLEKFEFHIIPVFNPDGYAYTWRTDRLWRKTRSFSINSPFCRGADANRNFDSHFCANDPDEDNRPCGINYCGDYPFSEPEVTAFRDYALKLNKTNQLKAYFSLHSYQQKLLYPFAYTSDPPSNVIELINLSNIAVNAIQAIHGSVYTAGSASVQMYLASGVSIDWMYEKLNVPLSFAFELRDRGHYGFLLPKQMIVPTAEEAWEGIKAILDQI